MEYHFQKWHKEAEKEPDVHHLDVRCSWHRLQNTYEESRKYQQEGYIHCDNDIKVCRLKKRKIYMIYLNLSIAFLSKVMTTIGAQLESHKTNEANFTKYIS